jgi:hypothetical protein
VTAASTRFERILRSGATLCRQATREAIFDKSVCELSGSNRHFEFGSNALSNVVSSAFMQKKSKVFE